MKKLNTLVLCFSFIITATISYSQCADSANIFSFNYSGKKYEIVKELKNWAAAAACAIERGGYLIEINDAAEQDTVFKSLLNGAKISPTYTQVPDGGGTAYIWTGATDKTTEGTWMWDGKNTGSGINFWNGQGAAGAGGGSAVGGKYVNWGGTSKGTPNEPDDYGSNQDGGAIALAGWPLGTTMLGSAGEWNDISSTNTIYYIIEFENSTGFHNNPYDLKNKIYLFPNPSNNTVELKLNTQPNSRLKINIFDMVGNLCFEFSDVSPQSNIYLRNIDTSSLNNGTYLVTVNIDGYNYTSKLYILH